MEKIAFFFLLRAEAECRGLQQRQKMTFGGEGAEKGWLYCFAEQFA